ncbi:MAG TPA: NAD(P)H-dependent oxidoreductase [Planctomycetota bacterium]|nr:NAD(P)H-dependent oxidoreductase [Planctomycetota bacterium]
MPTVSSTDLVERLTWRYATKRFDPSRKISEADWKTLEQALVLSPSSYGLQPWKAIVVQSPDLKKKLRPAAYNQAQIEESSHLVVLAARRKITEADVDRLVARTSKVRGVPTEKLAGYKASMMGDLVNGPRAAWSDHWAARQAYIALGTLLASAALLGIDACPMEGFVPDQFDEILGLVGGEHRSVVLCALGYRSPDDGFGKLAKVRFPADELILKK